MPKKASGKQKKAASTQIIKVARAVAAASKQKHKQKRITGGGGNNMQMIASERKVAVPAAYGSSGVVTAPKINGGGGFRVRHCEYLQQINLSTTFTPVVYNLNPGLVDSFPWLGQVGQLFEYYIFHTLRFGFKSRVGSNSTGQILMATQHDAADPTFASQEEMMGYAGATYANLWIDQIQDCLRGNSSYMKKNFTRAGPLASSDGVQLYDIGNFTIVALVNTTPSNAYAGDLFVEYDVTFFKPKVQPVTSISYISTQREYKANSATSGYWADANITDENHFVPTAEEPTLVGSGANLNITFPQVGYYTVDYNIGDNLSSTTAATTGAATASAGATILNEQFNSSVTGFLSGEHILLLVTTANAVLSWAKLSSQIVGAVVNIATVTSQVVSTIWTPAPYDIVFVRGEREKALRMVPKGNRRLRDAIEKAREVPPEEASNRRRRFPPGAKEEEKSGGWLRVIA